MDSNGSNWMDKYSVLSQSVSVNIHSVPQKMPHFCLLELSKWDTLYFSNRFLCAKQYASKNL